MHFKATSAGIIITSEPKFEFCIKTISQSQSWFYTLNKIPRFYSVQQIKPANKSSD